jgi:ElaB/YqjD/DUF883 family membrane-anchored ribosome-binding protein
MNTKGKTLLSGNIFCAHCGSHMIATSYVYHNKRTDSGRTEVRRHRYICCNKNRNRGKCGGQSGYASERIDAAVNSIVREYLDRIQTTAKSYALEKRYQTDISEMKAQYRDAEQENKRCKERLAQLTAEISKSLSGESSFSPDMLSMAIDNAKTALHETEDKMAQLNYSLNNSQGAMKKLNFYYEQFRSWAEEFDDAGLEERKMIVCQLIREINVTRGYKLDIVLDVNYEQFFSA